MSCITLTLNIVVSKQEFDKQEGILANENSPARSRVIAVENCGRRGEKRRTTDVSWSGMLRSLNEEL